MGKATLSSPGQSLEAKTPPFFYKLMDPTTLLDKCPWSVLEMPQLKSTSPETGTSLPESPSLHLQTQPSRSTSLDQLTQLEVSPSLPLPMVSSLSTLLRETMPLPAEPSQSLTSLLPASPSQVPLTLWLEPQLPHLKLLMQTLLSVETRTPLLAWPSPAQVLLSPTSTCHKMDTQTPEEF